MSVVFWSVCYFGGEREIELEVRFFWLMDIVVGDGPVTTDLYENVCRDVVTTNSGLAL